MGLELYKRAGLSEYLLEFEQVANQDFVPPNTYERLYASLSSIGGHSNIKPKIETEEASEPEAILSLRQRGRHLKGLESDIHGQLKAYANTPSPTEFKTQLYQLAKN